MSKANESVFPDGIRRVLLASLAILLALTLVLIVWRGPAILLDLSALGRALWCF